MALQHIRTNLFVLGVAAVLYYGWLNRDDNYISAENGAGYVLGIVGGSLMIFLLLYSVSKRVPLLTRILPIRYWFGIHMLFGTLGPVMILYHSNFHLGSINSTIALFSMLLVAGSGVIGRYIYTHIHHGLYGARITLGELKQETNTKHAELISRYDLSESLSEALNTHLNEMEKDALQQNNSLLKNLSQVIRQLIKTRHTRKKMIRLINDNYSEDNDSDDSHNGQAQKHTQAEKQAVIRSLKRYTAALQQAVALKLYERLFSLWHVFHMPLFIMMIITAIIHIIAVHAY